MFPRECWVFSLPAFPSFLELWYWSGWWGVAVGKRRDPPWIFLSTTFSLFIFSHPNPDRHQHMIFIHSHRFQSRDSCIKDDTENRYFFLWVLPCKTKIISRRRHDGCDGRATYISLVYQRRKKRREWERNRIDIRVYKRRRQVQEFHTKRERK